MRNGKFAIYKGIEYKFSSKGNKQVLLLSNDANDINRGFSASIHPGSYVKTVLRDELDEAYSIFTLAIYKGQEFLIRSEENGKVHIEGSGNEDLVSTLGFDYTEDRGIYRKWVNISDITSIRENKTPI